MQQMMVLAVAVAAIVISLGVFFAWYFSPSEVAYRQALEISRGAQAWLDSCEGFEGEAYTDCLMGR